MYVDFMHVNVNLFLFFVPDGKNMKTWNVEVFQYYKYSGYNIKSHKFRLDTVAE